MADALQAAFEAIDKYVVDHSHEPLAGDLVQVAKAKGLMFGYDHRWSSSGWRSVEVKQTFSLPIINPETSRSSRTYKFGGEQDGIVSFNGKNYLLEHKTSSEDISKADAPYWRRLEIDAQVSGYVLAEWQNGRKLEGTLYDVIRKPGIKPKQITKELAKEMQHSGTYYDAKVDTILGQGDIELPEHYQHRLEAETIDSELADWYFQRKVIYRMDNQMLEFAHELWQTADEIRLAALNDRHFRNSGACLAYNRACEYLGICSGHDNPDSGKWSRKAQIHEELETVDGDGRDLLTVSRMQCFRQCRRKHYYRYEMGIKSTKEEAEALFFGSMMHAGLAAWWLCQTPQPEVLQNV